MEVSKMEKRYKITLYFSKSKYTTIVRVLEYNAIVKSWGYVEETITEQGDRNIDDAIKTYQQI
jgi:hypothetical protein